jgi:hypothetical protein
LQQWASTKPTSTTTAYATSPQESPSLSSRNSKHLLKPSNTPNTTRTCHRCRVECEGRRVLQVWENNEGQFPQSSSASDANYASQFIHQTHIAHADTTTTMSLATTPSTVTKAARNVHTILLLASDFAIILSPLLAQAGYIYSNTKLDIKTHFHLQSDHAARPFDILFNPNSTSHHCCPYNTIGADITTTGTTPPPKRHTSKDIIQTITANADHHLQMHERQKLGCISKPATANTYLSTATATKSLAKNSHKKYGPHPNQD